MLAGSSENIDMFSPMVENQLGSLQYFGQLYTGEEGREGGDVKVSHWLDIDGSFLPSKIILPSFPVFLLFSLFFILHFSLSLSLSVSLMLWNVLPSVPSPWVQGPLPQLHYIKASMLHPWQPTLHFPDVITTVLPWNRSVLALWQFGNPPLSTSVFPADHHVKKLCSLGCQNKACFPVTLM